MPYERFPSKGPWARPPVAPLLKGLGRVLPIWLIGSVLPSWVPPRDGEWVVPPDWVLYTQCAGDTNGLSSRLSDINCINNQAGVVNENPANAPWQIAQGLTWVRYGVGHYWFRPDNGRADHRRSYYITLPKPAVKPTTIPHYVPPRAAVYPQFDIGWGPMRNPDALPVASGYIPNVGAPPLGEPVPENPGTPQWPDRGPYPDSPPDTVPFPGLEPWAPPGPVIVPDPAGQPGINPDAPHMPDSVVNMHPNGRVTTGPATRPDRVRRPPRGTKERKTHLRGAAAMLWRSFGAPTELADFIDVMYECLPKAVKVQAYKDNGRQPGAAARSAIIYQHINDLDIACAIQGFIENQIEDEILGRIGRLEAGANQRNPFGRPLGYGAGFAL